MPIINSNSIYANYIRMRHWAEHDYWYTSTDVIPNEVIEKVLSTDNTFFLVCNEFEIDSGLLNRIINLGIPREKIIFISEDADLTTNDYWACSGEMGMKIQCLKFPKFETLEKKDYTKSFLSFNRRWRLHRPLFVALLKVNGLLDKGLVSLGTSDDYQSWNLVFDDLVKLTDADITSHKDSIFQIPNMYLDTNDLISPKDRVDGSDLNKIIELYQNSYFSVVSETYFFENVGRFLTEKTFKAISFKHPFILMARPHSLKLLQSMGYKTFHPFINESYDDEVDSTKRMNLILNEVGRLSKMTVEQIHEFIDNVKLVTEYNFNHLTKKKQHIKKIG